MSVVRSEKLAGHLRPPSLAETCAAARRESIELGTDVAEAMTSFLVSTFELLDAVEELPPLLVELKHPRRSPGRPPEGRDEDPFNAFSRVLEIAGADDGTLKGKRLGIKDNLAIAGVPVTNASRTATYTPLVDAVVVERILDAGGTIVGKLNLDNLSAGAFGESSFFGPPLNPRNPAYSAGGSSGGAGAAVAGGNVDMALGVDQGGSARIPAAFCGCVSIKASHGLVPSFGVSHFDHTLDSICPVTKNVGDAAVLLEVIAGDDSRDPQWVREPVSVAAYAQADGEGVSGMRIGLLQEPLDSDLCEESVLRGVERARAILEDGGASVEHVSLPRFAHTSAIWFAVFLGAASAMIRTDGLGYNHLGYVEVERIHLAGLSRRLEASSFGVFVQAVLIGSAYLIERYGHAFFAKAHMQRLALRRDVDEALAAFDLLLTPTCPTTAPLLPQERLSVPEQLERLPNAGVYFPFTQAFNLTGHPALVLPSGVNELELPTSVQLVGSRFSEYDVFRAAFALERDGLSLAA